MATNNLAVILEEEGKNQLANRYLREAETKHPRNPHLSINLGINSKRAGRFKEALSHYNKCLEVESTNDICNYNLGVIHNIESEYDKAISHFKQSISDNPSDNIHAYLALGDALERKKDVKQAIHNYRQLLS